MNAVVRHTSTVHRADLHAASRNAACRTRHGTRHGTCHGTRHTRRSKSQSVPFSRMSQPTTASNEATKAAHEMSKKRLRQTFEQARRDMTDVSVEEKSRAIMSHVAALPEVKSASCLHAYWPIGGENEVNTIPFIVSAHREGKTIALPVVTSFDRSSPQMTQRAFSGTEDLAVNRWGIAEPVSGPHVPLVDIDAVLVPALGAGRDGHRIGHGWGYYDRFLSMLPGAKRIVLAFEACMRDTMPHNDHDVPADVVVTEACTYRISRIPSSSPTEP